MQFVSKVTIAARPFVVNSPPQLILIEVIKVYKMAQNQTESNDAIKSHLLTAEQTLQQTMDTYNKTKLSLSFVQTESSIWSQLLTEKQSELIEKQQQCSIERESFLNTRDSFAEKIEKCLNPGILDYYVNKITERTEIQSKKQQQMTMKCMVYNEMSTWQSDVDKEIAELNEQLKEIETKISSYDCDGGQMISGAEIIIEPNPDDELLIKRLQQATTSVLETVEKTERQVKVVADQIFKKLHRQNSISTYVPFISSTEKRQPDPKIDNHANDAEVPNTIMPEIVDDDTEIDVQAEHEEQSNSVVIIENSEIEKETIWTDDVEFSAGRTEYNGNVMEPSDCLYTSDGIDKQINIALNNNSSDYSYTLTNYQQYDDEDDFEMLI